MVKAFQLLSTTEIVVGGVIVMLAVWVMGSIANAVLKDRGLGTIPNGMLMLGGLLSGALVRSSGVLAF